MGLPGMTGSPTWEFNGNDPDEFVSKDRVARYLMDYAAMIKAPIREGVEVLEATRVARQGWFPRQDQ